MIYRVVVKHLKEVLEPFKKYIFKPLSLSSNVLEDEDISQGAFIGVGDSKGCCGNSSVDDEE